MTEQELYNSLVYPNINEGFSVIFTLADGVHVPAKVFVDKLPDILVKQTLPDLIIPYTPIGVFNEVSQMADYRQKLDDQHRSQNNLTIRMVNSEVDLRHQVFTAPFRIVKHIVKHLDLLVDPSDLSKLSDWLFNHYIGTSQINAKFIVYKTKIKLVVKASESDMPKTQHMLKHLTPFVDFKWEVV